MKENGQTQGGGKVATQSRLDRCRIPEKPRGDGALPPWILQNNLGSAHILVLHFLQNCEAVSFYFFKHSASANSL